MDEVVWKPAIEYVVFFYYYFLAGRPPLGQMPFIVTPEGKILAQSGAILKYICKKGGKQNYILQSFRFTPCKGVNPAWIFARLISSLIP